MYLAGVWSREYWPLSGEFTYTWAVKSAVMYELHGLGDVAPLVLAKVC